VQEEKEEDMFFTAQANTLLQKYTGSSRGNGTMVEKELDLGTLVIVDDRDEDNMDTMKRMDTGVVQKEPAPFMKHFAQEEQQRKVGRKQPMAGPQNISYYFPDIPEGMDLRDFLKTLTVQQLEDHMAALDKFMDQELEALRKRYHQKRLPILQAMDAKKRQYRN
jgi:hypothetical protein